MHGGCLVVFPAGGASTVPTVWHKRATDAEWKIFTGRLISQAKAPVAPVYFAGQNSRLFQIASHISHDAAALAVVQGSPRQDRQRHCMCASASRFPYDELAKFDRKVLDGSSARE